MNTKIIIAFIGLCLSACAQEQTEEQSSHSSYTDIVSNFPLDVDNENLAVISNQVKELREFNKIYDAKKLSNDNKILVSSMDCKKPEIIIETFEEYKAFFIGCMEYINKNNDLKHSIQVIIDLQGQIDHTTFEFLKYIYALAALAEREPQNWGFPSQRYLLFLDSPGGDVYSAMNSGPIISKLFDAAYIVGEGCYSSCVFLMAAAKKRFLSGIRYTISEDPQVKQQNRKEIYNAMRVLRDGSHKIVGIHSPFPFNSAEVSETKLLELRANFVDKAKNYFSRHGASTELVELMMMTPSDTIKLLSFKDLENFGLLGDNVIYIETERLKMRQTCGAEFEMNMLRFDQAIGESCYRASDQMACMKKLATHFGVTKKECTDFGLF